MVKSLDGIKKLNPDDIKKYRKIVLNYIGEKDSAVVLEQNKSSQGIVSSSRVDGVNVNKANRFAAKRKEAPKKAFIQGRPVSVLDGAKEESVKSREREEERMREAIKRQEEERKRLKKEERQYQINQEQAEQEKRREEKLRLEALEKEEKIKAKEKISLEKEKIKQEELKKREIVEKAERETEEIKRIEKIRQAEEKMRMEKLAEEETRRIKENLRLEKMKREEEIKRIKQEMKIKKQAAREKKIIKRQKVWRKIKKNLNLKLNSFFSKIKQNIIYIVSFLILLLAIAYIVFCLAVLRFNNNLTGWAASYLPVPAAITSQGIISYNNFRKIEDRNYLDLNLVEKKKYLAKWVVWRDLREKYRLPAEATNDDLAIKYVLDKDFNQIGLSRINKINELLKAQNVIESLSKYADEYSVGVYYNGKSAAEKFGPAVLALVIGQTSQVIPRTDGYYIVERLDDKKGQLGLKYLFVKSLTLDQYVYEEAGKIKVFILAN